MPNHCFNRVTLSGPSADISHLSDLLCVPADNGTTTITFAKLVPEPPGLHDPNPDGSPSERWYDWRLTHWGTKWDVYGVEITGQDAETLSFECITAWGPPEAFVEALRTRFPNVRVSWFYDEPNCELAGYL